MSSIRRSDFDRRRPSVSITEQMDIINEHPERYSDLVGYFSLPLTNVEFKQDGEIVYWRVVGSSSWKVLFDLSDTNNPGMKFKGEVKAWTDIKQLISEGVYDPAQGDVWKITSKNKVIVYYQAHWVTLFEGTTPDVVPSHSHKMDEIEGLDEAIDSKIAEKSSVQISQTSASDQWEIKHNLGRYPSITVVDSAGNIVYGDVQYIDVNNIRLNFSSAFSGKVILN